MAGPELDDCHCCEGLVEPGAISNAPGLAALVERIDTQPGFRARMLQELPLAKADRTRADSSRPLARLLMRSPDDPAVALVDAAACVADVLTFYHERIANEGFLRTAIERRSVLELARTIGYELKPGVAASTWLSFTVEDAPGAPGLVTMAKGSPVQSVPPQDKLPQTFETSDALVARAEWNALRPRLLRPADMAVGEATNPDGTKRQALLLLGPAGSFAPGTPNVQHGIAKSKPFRLDPRLPIDDVVDAVEVDRLYVADSTTGIASGDLLLFSGKAGDALGTLVLRVVEAVPEPADHRLRIVVEALPAPQASTVPPLLTTWFVPYAIKPVMALAKPQLATVAFTGQHLTTTVANQSWREGDLQAMIGMQRWSGDSLVKAIGSLGSRTTATIAPDVGAFAFGAKLGFFGHNGPRWKTLPKPDSTHGDAYPQGWDEGDTNTAPLAPPRRVWSDSQGASVAPQHAFLERAVPGVARGTWVVLDAPDVAAKPYPVFDAREVSRADYGLSGRAMSLTLADASGHKLAAAPSDPYRVRTTTAHVASRRLVLVDLPIDAAVDRGDRAIELDRMVIGMTIGKPVALMGELDDTPGVQVAEIATIADIVHAQGRTTLTFVDGLANRYRRSTLVISANVVRATHGESVTELLGQGDASLAHQRFTLKKPPTTFVPASTASGVATTLVVRVAGIAWDEVPSLYGASPDARVYTTRIDDDARMQVVFGDGVRGARLPTGSVNVAATYRSGLGPDGEVEAGTLTLLRAKPLGLRDVSNPVAATGAEGPERLDDAKRNAPLTLLTFDRVVSLLDYAAFARGYPGIGKARGDLVTRDGVGMLLVSVAGATGGVPSDDLVATLTASISGASDRSQRFVVEPFVPRYFRCSLRVVVDSHRIAADVLAAVEAALLAAFSFEHRALAQSVTMAEVITLAQGVPGVVAVDLVALIPYDETTVVGDDVRDAVPAFGGRWDSSRRAWVGADLLLVNPAAVDVTEMPA